MHYHRPEDAVPCRPIVSSLPSTTSSCALWRPTHLLAYVSLGVERRARPRLVLDGAADVGVRRDGLRLVPSSRSGRTSREATIGKSVAGLCRRRDCSTTDCEQICRVRVADIFTVPLLRHRGMRARPFWMRCAAAVAATSVGVLVLRYHDAQVGRRTSQYNRVLARPSPSRPIMMCAVCFCYGGRHGRRVISIPVCPP